MTREIYDALQAIIDGYPATVQNGFIVVENPDFQEDNGKNPKLVIDCKILLGLLDPR